MKFTLTAREIENLVREKYNLPVGCSVEIDSGSELHDKIKDKIARETGLVPRVKALRELAHDNGAGFTLGLHDAKCAIEHYDSFLDFVKTNNRWPKEGYCKLISGSYITDYR